MAVQDNVARFPKSRGGFYEVYYIKAHHLKEKCALWIRYTFYRPEDPEREPHGALWAIFFDGANAQRHLALKNIYPLESCRFELKKPALFIGQAMLGQESLRGKVEEGENQIAWQLDFNPNEETFFFFPSSLLYQLPFPKSKVVSPNQNIYLYGLVTVNGRTISFDGEPAQQSHIWGTKHAESWGWAHSNAFLKKGNSLMELLTAKARIGKKESPWISLGYFEYEGKKYRYNTFSDILRNTMVAEPGKLTFSCSDGLVKFEGEVEAKKENIIGVTYEDPDGEHLYCYNSSLASVKAVLSVKEGKKWVQVDTLESQGGAALEYATRHKLPDYPLYL